MSSSLRQLEMHSTSVCLVPCFFVECRLTPPVVVDLQSYPANVFSFLLAVGLFSVRKRRMSLGAPPAEFRAWNGVLLFTVCVNIYLLVLPWVPPEGGIYAGDVSFFYATYCIVGLAM